MSWLTPSLYYVGKDNNLKSAEICFDLDSTLVKSKNKHPKDENDWEWIYDSPEFLKILPGFIVITNQLGFKTKDFILKRILNIFRNFNNYEIYISTDPDIYGKPNTGIFENYLSGIKLYVGDAAGRESDFSDSDRKFVYNINLYQKYSGGNKVKFLTPEAFFLNIKETPSPKLNPNLTIKSTSKFTGFDPKLYLKYSKSLIKDYLNTISEIEKLGRSIFVLIGPPASGKSTFSKYLASLRDSVIVTQENSTKKKCLSEFQKYLNTDKNIIVDNCNADRKTRENYDSKFTYYIYFTSYNDPEKDKELYMHLNYYRMRLGSKLIPAIAYHKFYKNLELEKNMFRIPFVPEFGKLEKMRFLQLS